MPGRPVRLVAAALAAGLFLASPAAAQRPASDMLPDELPLSRANLTRMWHAQLAMQRVREHVTYLTVFEGMALRRPSAVVAGAAPPTPFRERDAMVFACTSFGMLHCFDLETGKLRWQAEVGNEGIECLPPSVAGNNVFAAAGDRLVQLERESGRMIHERRMRGPATSGPIANRREIYINVRGGSMLSFELPDPDFANVRERVPQGIKFRPDVLQPGGKEYVVHLPPGQQRRLEALPETWHSPETKSNLVGAPLLAGPDVVFLNRNGEIVSMRQQGKDGGYRLFNRLPIPESTVAAVLGGRLYYQVSDLMVYCVNAHHGRTYWEYGAGRELLGPPLPFADDVLLSVSGTGVHCLANETGTRKWTNTQATRALGQNAKFAYATDRAGNLLVISRQNGDTLALAPMAGFSIAAQNQLNDRLFLASPRGVLVALRDKQLEKAEIHPQIGGTDDIPRGEGRKVEEFGKKKEAKGADPDVEKPKPAVAPRKKALSLPPKGKKGKAGAGAGAGDDADPGDKKGSKKPKGAGGANKGE